VKDGAGWPMAGMRGLRAVVLVSCVLYVLER
jgi:hypothetical protein